MRIALIRTQERVCIARIEAGEALILEDASVEPDVDILRRLLAGGTDFTSREPRDAAPIGEVELLAPLSSPQKIIAIGLNYADHARESGTEPPSAPVAFAKLPNSIIGPDEPIRFRRADTQQVDYEAELAVVIGRRGRDIPEERALDHVFGYTVCNDVSARDAQFADGQWIRGKSYDTFCPLGPWIVTADELPDPQSLAIRCRVNGETLQDSSTKEMIFGVAELVSYLSRFLTVEAGDVIATGTPYGVGFARTPPRFLGDGDVVEVEVEGIGTLRNPVIVEG
ncbi:MAG: fumarylacetoacetate hydrolase family protein [Actinobacteria bacterium]|nr:fumarylacetoacetate hydrolase family protein [Actinomycetota bacterium]